MEVFSLFSPKCFDIVSRKASSLYMKIKKWKNGCIGKPYEQEFYFLVELFDGRGGVPFGLIPIKIFVPKKIVEIS